MNMQVGIPYFKYSFQYGGGDGELVEHDHSTIGEGGAVPLASITGHSKAIHDALAILHSSLGGIGIDNHHPKIHKTEHETDGGDAINHNVLVNYLASQHLTLPGAIASVLSNHSKAVHDALGIDADTVDSLHLPGLIADILSNHTKAVHDALLINADKVDNMHIPGTLIQILLNHTKAEHDSLAINADKVDGEEASAIVTNARVKAHFPDTIANILSNHSKAVHDALGINADTVDSLHLPGIIGDILTNHTKTVHMSMGLAGGNIPSCRVRRIGDQSIPERSWTKIIWNSKSDGWDNLNNWSTVNSEFTVPAGHAGRYLCTLVLEFEEMGDDANNKIAGGVATDRPGYEMQNMTIGRWLPVHEGIYSIVLAGIVDVLVGNKIWSMCEQYNDASENRPLSGDPRYSFFCIQKMVD